MGCCEGIEWCGVGFFIWGGGVGVGREKRGTGGGGGVLVLGMWNVWYGKVWGRLGGAMGEYGGYPGMDQKFICTCGLLGGPGFPATLPIDAGTWLRTATNYFRVILLDQRGTGLSTPISCRNLAKRGTPAQQAEYLKFFR